jgi:hypothetical protein
MSKFNPELVGKVFDSDQKEVLLDLQGDLASQLDSKIESGTEKAVASILQKQGIDREIVGLTDAEQAYLKMQKTVSRTRSLWDNNGFVPGVRGRITLADLQKKDVAHKANWEKNGQMIDGVFSTDQPLILPRVLEQVVRESIEPNLVLTPLFERVSVTDAGTTITFPAVGNALVAADIPEGGEYPEQSLEFAGEVVAKIGKSGVAVKLTDEMIRYSMFDIMSMHLRAAGRAMTRHKEQKVADQIFGNGTTFFDNTVAGKHTAGRGPDGFGNDTMTLDDILFLYADLSNAGFIPDTLIMHPFAWFGMAREPVMRELFMQGGGQGMYYQSYQGTVGSANAWQANSLVNNTTLDDPRAVASTFTIPGITPTPLSVIVTPFQESNSATHTTTITMCSRSELGLILEDEALVTEEWDDPAHDIRKVKFRERYGLALKNNGTAIRHAKNVNWFNKGHSFDDLLTWQAGTGTLPDISTGALNIVG